ncbi:MAG: dGTP triphosphohydrolase [Verrucomicrobiota bacterium]
MPANTFYNDFDRATLETGQKPRRRGPDRSEFQLDRDRIIFSTAFRRLQNKTQVFQAGEYDFYRTRLTHSLEVGTIAKSICQHLRATSRVLREDFHLDLDLVEAVSLAHDMGHPPFGHAGERVLHRLMEKYGGFEGNAQSLRILTRIIYDQKDGRFGMAPTRALLDGILKYKRLFRDRNGGHNHFIYDDQAEYLEFCFGTADLATALPADLSPNGFKSLECQIMDAADDIAYSSFDIVDSIKARFLTAREVTECLELGYIGRRTGSEEKDARLLWLTDDDRAQLEKLRGHIIDGFYDASLNKNIGRLIQSCSLAERENFMAARSNRYRYELVVPPELKREMKVMKELARRYVFQNSLMHQMEFKGNKILESISEAFEANYLEKMPAPGGAALVLVSDHSHAALLAEPEPARRARMICDYLAGMTDAYAVRQYKRLYAPDYGSISEIL